MSTQVSFHASKIEPDVEEVIFNDKEINEKAEKLARLLHSTTEIRRKRTRQSSH